MSPPLLIFLAWCLLLPAFCGIGFAATRLIPGSPEHIGWSLAFWLGVGVSTPLLAGWHLLLPVDGRVWILLGPLAALGLALEGIHLSRRRALFFAGFAATALWLATRAALPGSVVDDGLYYTQTVRWNSLYAAVPGLGNLHPFLALNDGFHLLVAAVGVGPFHFRGEHLANGLFLLAAFAPCASALVRVLDPRLTASAADFFAALLICTPLDAALSGYLSAPAADLAASMADTGLLVAVLCPALCGARPGTRRTGALIVACGGALTLKPSTVCIVAPLAIFAAAWWLRARPAPRERSALALFIAVAGVAIAGPWIGHSVVLSGYPVYPSPALALGVDWRMDRTIVVSMYRWVYAFARWPGHSYAEVTASSDWVRRWFGREWLNDRTFLIPAALAACATLALGVALSRSRRPPRAVSAAAATAALSVALWWMLAPDTRFAGPLLWATGGLLTLAAACAFRPALDGATRAALAAGVLVSAGTAFFPMPQLFVWPHALPSLRHDPPTTRQVALPGGGTIHFNHDGLCWDPPCARPPVDPRLRLRSPNQLSSGFSVEPVPSAAAAPEPR